MGLSGDISIKQAQEEVEQFLEERGKDWTQVDNRFYVFTHMIEEIGELARHIINVELKLSLDRTSREAMPRKDELSRIENDLGDILYHILKLAIAYDIDLTIAFGKAMLDIKGRYGKKRI
ncbi:MAG: MazG nucleotide pyrophosphohydrolase domain-containing protein [Candidatus Heimdallarchaeota archaeon]